jgi:hypothetical protein
MKTQTETANQIKTVRYLNVVMALVVFVSSIQSVAQGISDEQQVHVDLSYLENSAGVSNPNELNLDNVIPVNRLSDTNDLNEVLSKIARFSVDSWIKEVKQDRAANPLAQAYRKIATLESSSSKQFGKFQMKVKLTDPNIQAGFWGKESLVVSMDLINGSAAIQYSKKIGEKVLSIVNKHTSNGNETLASIKWGF